MSGPSIKDYASAIENVAFKIPSPNEFTPVLMMLAGGLRKIDFDQLRTQPDARLISAAPDMAEALEHLLIAIDLVCEEAPYDPSPDVARARAALAKARGGE